MNKTEELKEIQHVNPNCLGAKYCEPHSERGEVFYSSANVKKLIKQSNREAVDGFVSYFVSTVKPVETGENPFYIKFLDLIQAEIDYVNSLEKGTNNE